MGTWLWLDFIGILSSQYSNLIYLINDLNLM